MPDVIFFINPKFGTFAKYSQNLTSVFIIDNAKVTTYERNFQRD